MAYESNNANELKKKMKKTRSKAKFAGVLYFLGTILLLALACFGLVTVDGEKLWALSLLDAFKNLGMNIETVVAALYLLGLVIALINVFCCFPKLGWLSKRSTKYVDGHEKNRNAMLKLGKIFSCSFATLLIMHLLIYIVKPADAVAFASFDMVPVEGILAYAFIAVGLVVHFLAGLVGGGISYFTVDKHATTMEEEKRTGGLFVYFFRNLVQVAAVAAILYFFVPVCTLNTAVDGVLSNDLSAITSNILPVALEGVLLLCLLIMLGHAVAPTEYNHDGINGKGMKTFRVFSLFATVAAAVTVVLNMETTPIGLENKYLFIAVIAFVAFLVDCIFKTKAKKEKKEKKSKKAKKTEQTMEEQPMMPSPFMPPMPPVVANNQVKQMSATAPVAMPAQSVAYGMPQPVYIPIYYPYPVQHPAPPVYPTYPAYPAYPCAPAPCAQMNPCAASAPECGQMAAPVAATNGVCARPAPAPAPAHLKAAPAPAVEVEDNKKNLREEGRNLKLRGKALKKAKETAKKNKKLAKKNAKAEAKLIKQETKFAKKNSAIAEVAPEPELEVVEEKLVVNNIGETSNVEVKKPVNPEVPVEGEVVELQTALDPKKTWNVRCPKCGKQLTVREVSPYHRCPSCDKVFQIRKFETYVKKEI